MRGIFKKLLAGLAWQPPDQQPQQPQQQLPYPAQRSKGHGAVQVGRVQGDLHVVHHTHHLHFYNAPPAQAHLPRHAPPAATVPAPLQ